MKTLVSKGKASITIFNAEKRSQKVKVILSSLQIICKKLLDHHPSFACRDSRKSLFKTLSMDRSSIINQLKKIHRTQLPPKKERKKVIS